MTRYKLLNGKKVKFTKKEEAARDKEEQDALLYKENQQQAIENEKAKRESGKQKLKDLGLDDDEINALLGV
tara:strand:- start:249 stop:461 length:213 start_codon:yes stop_codon:yes gene_type:complete